MLKEKLLYLVLAFNEFLHCLGNERVVFSRELAVFLCCGKLQIIFIRDVIQELADELHHLSLLLLSSLHIDPGHFADYPFQVLLLFNPAQEFLGVLGLLKFLLLPADCRGW